MSIFNLADNNLSGVQAYQQSANFQELRPEEREVLNRYVELGQTGSLNSRTVVELSNPTDADLVTSSYCGGGTVEEAVSASYTDGVEPPMFIGKRPYLFFVNPETSQFYFMRNPDVLSAEVPALEVLDVSTRTWVRVDDLEPFFGRPHTVTAAGRVIPDGTASEYPGLIKAHFLVTQFNKTDATVKHDQDDIDHYTQTESLESKARGDKYYCEKQKNTYCQIHAVNAFLGYSAIRPTQLNEYIQLRAGDFSHAHVEGLAAGELPDDGKALSHLFNIEGGTDLGMAVDYMHQLESQAGLKVSVANIEVGAISYSEEDGLVFENHATNERHKVDHEFLATRSRAMFGTIVAPIHAAALRKNTDGSWTKVDSLEPGQKVSEDLQATLIALVREQGGGSQVNLPFAIM